MRKGAGMPPAWPPGGLKDGEGLPLNDLPDVSMGIDCSIQVSDGFTTYSTLSK